MSLPPFLKELNPEQQVAVQHGEGPLLVIAGAGSGKTRIVTFRIAYLIHQGVNPSEILGVTFTNKAAGEMKKRVEKLVLGPSPLISTFHSLGAKILRESIHHLGYNPNFTIYDEDNSLSLIKRCLVTFNVKEEALDAKGMRALISSAKNQCIPRESAETFFGSPLLAQIFKLYQERLFEAGAVDFDDLLYLPVQLFNEDKELLAGYQKRWRYLLIDEYQDTNEAQYLIAKFLVAKSQNLFVVGDPDQAIYSWRGANIQNILNFEKDYAGSKVVKLEQNYRTVKPILDAANALICHNQSRLKKNLWSQKSSDEKIGLYVAYSESDEAEFVCEEIDFLNEKKQVPLDEVALLYRTNFQSRSLEDALLRHRLPYVIIGGLSFYHRKEIKDILSYLQIIASDSDFMALHRTLQISKKGIGETSLERIRLGAKEANLPLIPFCEKLSLGQAELKGFGEKQRGGLKSYLNTLFALRELSKVAPLQKLVMETINRFNYLDVLREEKETFDERKANLDELIGKAAERDMSECSSPLINFLEELCLKGATDEMKESTPRVVLMTLHNGKGLEFNTVFLTGMEEDLFPHANAKGDFSKVEEERRLCYVGMTRAKERLYLTAAENRFLWGGFRKMKPSRFLYEIPKEKLERIK